RQLARARTFGFTEDVERLWQAGYAHGASLANTLVIGGGRLLNPDGLRFKDEHVRHKALDAIGDLALGGAPILGAYKSTRGGHRLNYAVLTALLKDASAWTYVDAPLPAPEPRERALPTRGRGEVGAFVQPAFGPEIS
ncbi:MAG: UDP-3-O-acyl-N-acetylglucosamine deacetylase, partial [Variibacter sp.]|nr:UDP-3-O-acyl-N-acetylglucosamine deacetylase [Variibacter sp.]